MQDKNPIAPLVQELPSHYADRLGVAYASSVSQEHKKINGQFFTPIEIASFMASYSKFSGDSVRILDPGCGSIILSCALIEYFVKSNKNLKPVELVAYEVDSRLIPIAEQSISYLEKWGQDKGIKITTTLHTEDFVMHNVDCLKGVDDLFAKPIELFDIIISNPPYFKLSIDDKNRLVAAPYFCNFIESDYIGVENKVNYIYRPGGHLERNEVVGLCVLLNSSLFDTYFRIFNGNVNVSATELREMPLPPSETIQEIGNSIILSNDFSVRNTNRVVNEYFEPAYTA